MGFPFLSLSITKLILSACFPEWHPFLTVSIVNTNSYCFHHKNFTHLHLSCKQSWRCWSFLPVCFNCSGLKLLCTTDHWMCSALGTQCTNMKLGLREIQFPQIWGDSEERSSGKFQWERNLISLWNKSMWQFPWIWGAEWAPSDFEGVFRHFVMNLSDFFWLQTRVNAHGRDNQSFPTSLVPKKWLYLASTFFAPALRGSPHSSQNQIQIQITNLMMRRAGLSITWGRGGLPRPPNCIT